MDWHSLGVKLGVKDYELSTVGKNFTGDNERCKHEMLSRWLRSVRFPTWKTVADALHQMGDSAVASKIREKYCGSPPGMCLCYVVHLISI